VVAISILPFISDEKSSRDRVVLVHEAIDIYDASYYETQLVRAVESILAPLDWIGTTSDENSTEHM
jgi:DNA polymerase I